MWLISIAVISVAGFKVYTFVNKPTNQPSLEIKKVIENKELVTLQEKQIKDQQKIIENMKQSIEQMKASHEETLQIVKELSADQKKVEIKITNKKKTIEKSLNRIESLNISTANKEKQKTKVLIKGLNDTYCELFINSCNQQGNAK
jgi:septal ring factor EnvC (AmiA/AmiB activator)